jgi:allophanate hydrolase subunit 1
MTYCTADEQVVYQSSLFTLNYFQTRGDTMVTALNGGAFNHLDCVTPAITNMLGFFDGLRVNENNLTVTLTADSESSPGTHNATIHVSVSGGTGFTIQWNTGSTDSILSGLANGVYTVTVTDAHGCTKVRSISTGGVMTGIETLSAMRLQVLPNPATTVLNIQVSDIRPDMISILNVNGQKVNEQKYSSRVDISALASGVYIIEVWGARGTVRSRFVKL